MGNGVISGPLSFGIVSGNLSLSVPRASALLRCHVDVQFRGNPSTFHARVPCRHAFHRSVSPPRSRIRRLTVTVKSRETRFQVFHVPWFRYLHALSISSFETTGKMENFSTLRNQFRRMRIR